MKDFFIFFVAFALFGFVALQVLEYYYPYPDKTTNIEERIDNLEKVYQDHLCNMHKRKDLSLWDALHCEKQKN
jgi:hypothetical protein